MNKYSVTFKTPIGNYVITTDMDESLDNFIERIKRDIDEIISDKSGYCLTLQNNKKVLLQYKILANTAIEVIKLQGDK